MDQILTWAQEGAIILGTIATIFGGLYYGKRLKARKIGADAKLVEAKAHDIEESIRRKLFQEYEDMYKMVKTENKRLQYRLSICQEEVDRLREEQKESDLMVAQLRSKLSKLEALR